MQPIIKPSIWRVNRGRSLSSRLAFYSVHPGASTVWNAVDGRSAPTSAIFTPTPYGRCLSASTEGSAPSFPLGYMPIRGSNGDGSGDFTLLVVANPDTVTPSALFSQRTNASPNFTQLSVITNFNVLQTTTPGALCLFLDDASGGGSGIDFGVTSNTTAVDGKWHSYVLGCSNGTYFVYVDGRLNVASQTAPGVNRFVSGAPQTLRVGGFGGTTGSLANCGIAATAAWNRALSIEEVQSITRDPWLPLRPTRNTSRVVFAAGSGTSISPTGAVATAAAGIAKSTVSLLAYGASAASAAAPLQAILLPGTAATASAGTVAKSVSIGYDFLTDATGDILTDGSGLPLGTDSTPSSGLAAAATTAAGSAKVGWPLATFATALASAALSNITGAAASSAAGTVAPSSLSTAPGVAATTAAGAVAKSVSVGYANFLTDAAGAILNDGNGLPLSTDFSPSYDLSFSATSAASPLTQLIALGASASAAAAPVSIQEIVLASGALATSAASSLVNIKPQSASASAVAGSATAVVGAIPATATATSTAGLTAQKTTVTAAGAATAAIAAAPAPNVSVFSIGATATGFAGAITPRISTASPGAVTTATAATLSPARAASALAVSSAGTEAPLITSMASSAVATSASSDVVATKDTIAALAGVAAVSSVGALGFAVSKAPPGIAASGIAASLAIGISTSATGTAATSAAGALVASVAEPGPGASTAATAGAAAIITTALPVGASATLSAAAPSTTSSTVVAIAGSPALAAAATLSTALQRNVAVTGTSATAGIGAVVATPSPSPAGASAFVGAASVYTSDTLGISGALATTLARVLSGSIVVASVGAGSVASASALGISSGFRIPNAVAATAAAALNILGSTSLGLTGARAYAIPADLSIFTLTPVEALLRANVVTLPPDLRTLTVPTDM